MVELNTLNLKNVDVLFLVGNSERPGSIALYETSAQRRDNSFTSPLLYHFGQQNLERDQIIRVEDIIGIGRPGLEGLGDYMTSITLSAYHTSNSIPDFRRANNIRRGIREFLAEAEQRTRGMNPNELSRLENEIRESRIIENVGEIIKTATNDYTDGRAVYFAKAA